MTKMRNDEESIFFQALFNSDYQQQKARTPDKVPGTCQRLFQNVRYKRWIEDSCSGLLWVTADPGCGKSVLSKSLIEHEDRKRSVGASAIRYFFFFKDDNADQKSVTKAICALLHQLFKHCERPRLLKKAVDLFASHRTNMLASFLILWKPFLSIAQDQEVGEVICILDALYECEEESQEVLFDALNACHSSIVETNGRLKLLVTSSPYKDIRQRFGKFVIHLAGKEESQGIEQDIDLVIRRSVPRISSQLKLDPDTKSVLQEKHYRNPTVTISGCTSF